MFASFGEQGNDLPDEERWATQWATHARRITTSSRKPSWCVIPYALDLDSTASRSETGLDMNWTHCTECDFLGTVVGSRLVWAWSSCSACWASPLAWGPVLLGEVLWLWSSWWYSVWERRDVKTACQRSPCNMSCRRHWQSLCAAVLDR